MAQPSPLPPYGGMFWPGAEDLEPDVQEAETECVPSQDIHGENPQTADLSPAREKELYELPDFSAYLDFLEGIQRSGLD